MSVNVAPVKAAMSAVSAVAPKSPVAKAVALGESIMPRSEDKANPAKTIAIKILDTFIEKAKTKPDGERNVIDYVLIIADKLKDMNFMKYAA